MEEGLVRVCVGWEDEGEGEGGAEEDGMELVREFEKALRVVEEMEMEVVLGGQKVNGDAKVNGEVKVNGHAKVNGKVHSNGHATPYVV